MLEKKPSYFDLGRWWEYLLFDDGTREDLLEKVTRFTLHHLFCCCCIFLVVLCCT